MDTMIQDGRARLLAAMPLDERAVRVAGTRTAVLEGGSGPPLVLLHGPGEHAAKWLRVAPELVRAYRVVAPDLPGHGASDPVDPATDVEGVVDWLDAVLQATCPQPPILVGQILGGALAARFASRRPGRVAALVLVDMLGLAPFRPTPAFGEALAAFAATPGEETHDRLWQRCAYDLPALRDAMGERWHALRAYNLDRARVPALQASQARLMALFGLPAIPPDELARIDVPTTLVWGRHDEATRLDVAREASTRFGWPLHVVEAAADDPPLEQPEAFLAALGAALGRVDA